jgi:YesN/AraC family two-component response regulator
MIEYKASIEKICKFAFNFTNIDTVFIDASSTIQLELGHTHVPEPLKPYWRNVNDLITMHEYASNQHALIHLTCYMTNFISVKVCVDNKYLGSIVVGPYLSEEPSILMIENLIFGNKLPISLKNIIKQYYLSLPSMSTYKSKLIAESLSYNVLSLDFMNSHTIYVESKKYNSQTEYPFPPDIIRLNTEHSIDLIEKRYQKENELLHTIEMGDIEKLQKLSEEWSYLFQDMPDRVPNDPLRSRKNQVIVFNTLLRKAAEKGGLHPLDVHSLSDKFAIQIEQTTNLQQLKDLVVKMRITYCDAVRKLSLKNFKYLTQKAIEYIRRNLDGNLSLKTISSSIGVSTYELSRQFSKETDHNITEYISIQRINEAIYIMENQNISLTDIAYMVGFNDLAYFTKVFKKLKGITPSEYRKNRS